MTHSDEVRNGRRGTLLLPLELPRCLSCLHVGRENVLDKVEDITTPVSPSIDRSKLAGIQLLRRAVVRVVNEPHIVDDHWYVPAKRCTGAEKSTLCRLLRQHTAGHRVPELR
jgi:hypothetical protein